MKFKDFEYKDELYVSVDLKKVRYDGRIYKVSSVEIINPDQIDSVKHRCSDGCEYSVSLDRYITYGNISYRVSFCNKCKTLFISPVLWLLNTRIIILKKISRI